MPSFFSVLLIVFIFLLNTYSANCQIGLHYKFLGTSDKLPEPLVKKQESNTVTGVFKPLKLKMPVKSKSEINQEPQIVQNSNQVANNINQYIPVVNSNQVSQSFDNSKGESLKVINAKSLKNQQVANGPLTFFEPTSPLDTYKTKLMNNAKIMLSLKKNVKTNTTDKVKVKPLKVKAENPKKIRNTTKATNSIETTVANSVKTNEINISSLINADLLTSSLKDILADAIKKAVDEQMDLKRNEILLNAKSKQLDMSKSSTENPTLILTSTSTSTTSTSTTMPIMNTEYPLRIYDDLDDSETSFSDDSDRIIEDIFGDIIEEHQPQKDHISRFDNSRSKNQESLRQPAKTKLKKIKPIQYSIEDRERDIDGEKEYRLSENNRIFRGSPPIRRIDESRHEDMRPLPSFRVLNDDSNKIRRFQERLERPQHANEAATRSVSRPLSYKKTESKYDREYKNWLNGQ